MLSTTIKIHTRYTLQKIGLRCGLIMLAEQYVRANGAVKHRRIIPTGIRREIQLCNFVQAMLICTILRPVLRDPEHEEDG